MQPANVVIADLADIARAPSPALAGHSSSRNLPAKLKLLRNDLDFRIKYREVRELKYGIRGVQAHTDKIHERCRFRERC
jgi:hypothetical protein